MPDHDAKVFNPPNTHSFHRADRIVEYLLGGFHRWDAVYFLHVAEHGYTYENTLAFFPLYPMTVRLAANSIFYPLQMIMNYSSLLLVTAVILNLIFFILAAKVLYRLSRKVLRDETLAYKSAQLFCINPATIFYSAPYSETTFALLTFYGMFYAEIGNATRAACMFSLSALARSNGLVNIGFIIHRCFIEFSMNFLSIIREFHYTDLKTSVKKMLMYSLSVLMSFLKYLLISCSLFAGYQWYAYSLFCNKHASYKDLKPHILNYGNSQAYKMAHTGMAKWCHYSIPLSYNYVQSTHWNVGLFRYYEIKQIPNFLLAAPMICLGFAAAYNFILSNRMHCLSLGLYQGIDERGRMKKLEDPPTSPYNNYGFKHPRCFVYVAHMLFLLLFGVLFMHIQVVTRFIASSSPVIYWYIASTSTPSHQLMPLIDASSKDPDVQHHSHSNLRDTSISDDVLDWDNKTWFNKAIFLYFHLYFFVGIAAFSNFLPWT